MHVTKTLFSPVFSGAFLLASLAPAWAADVQVTISNFAFAPAEITIKVGDTVTFTNGDDTIHSVVAADGSFRSDPLDSGDKFSFKFTRSGEVAFFCGLHPFMKGKIIIR
jgi:plastocyanin